MISILIPAYNGEKYISACLESVVNQTSNEYEVIIIDDGSTDKTYEICKLYSSNYRIKLYKQSNKGVTYTRNKLVKLANCEYFIFLDCDDILHYDTVKRLNTIIQSNKCDTVLFDVKQFLRELKFDDNNYVEKYKKNKAISDFLTINRRGYIAGILINKEKWNALHIKFELKKYIEDWFPIFFYVANSEHIYYIHSHLYFYRQLASSAISTSSFSVIENYNLARQQIYRYSKNTLNIERNYLTCFRVKTDLDILHEIYKLDKGNLYKHGLNLSCGKEKLRDLFQNNQLTLKEKIIYFTYKIRVYNFLKLLHGN